jgi:hypothetical protein
MLKTGGMSKQERGHERFDTWVHPRISTPRRNLASLC